MAEPLLHIKCDAQIGPLRISLDETLAANWTVLFGPSGSGKSTVLRLIAGLWSPSDSSVAYRGEDLGYMSSYRRRIGMVAQQAALFPHLTTIRNVAFGCTNNCSDFVSELLDIFELTTLANTYPSSLSGGEQQRVAIARALAARPRMLLLDEVFTGMHRALQERLMGTLREYSGRLEMPILSVTHDVAEAFACGDEVLRIEAGKITERGSATEVLASERRALLEHLNGS